MYSTRYSCPILMQLKFSRQIFEKYQNIKFHEIPSGWNRDVPCGQTDVHTNMMNLIVFFPNFTNLRKAYTN